MKKIGFFDTLNVGGVPVTGGGGGQVLLTSKITRVASGAQNLGTSPQKIPFDSIISESQSTFNVGLNRWVIPSGVPANTSGFLTFNMLFGGTNSNYAVIYKNGSAYRYGTFQVNGTTDSSAIPITCSPGDYFEIFAERQGGGSVDWDGNYLFNWAELILFGNYSPGAPKIAIVGREAYQTITRNTLVDVNFDTTISDPSGLLTSPTTFTIPASTVGTVTGTISCNFQQVEGADGSSSQNVTYLCLALKNGATYVGRNETYIQLTQAGTTRAKWGQVTFPFTGVANDTFKIQLYANHGSYTYDPIIGSNQGSPTGVRSNYCRFQID